MSNGAILHLVKIKSDDLPFFQDFSPAKFADYNMENSIDLKIVGNDNT
jgi:hypothetical protein